MEFVRWVSIVKVTNTLLDTVGLGMVNRRRPGRPSVQDTFQALKARCEVFSTTALQGRKIVLLGCYTKMLPIEMSVHDAFKHGLEPLANATNRDTENACQTHTHTEHP